MNDADGVAPKLAELLRHPDDLDKIPALKAEFARKKAAIDSHLKEGLREQLDVTKAGMVSITDGQTSVGQIKEEMINIDRLCAEAQNMIRDFPYINQISQIHRNFSQVESMRSDLENFNQRVAGLEHLLREDDNDLENMPNLLPIHYELSQLRAIRDEAMDQIKKASDSSLQGTLEEFFARLDDLIGWFDEHIGLICLNMISLVQNDNNGLVVRLAIIIEEEEKFDKMVKAVQEAQKEYKGLASRLKAITAGPKELRGYKEKFLESIRIHAQQQFDSAIEQFLEDPDKLERSMRWFFNELNTVKLGMVNLMPKKWRIFRTYGDIYHRLMHDNLVKLIDDPDLKPANMLAIIHWGAKYYQKMEKLGFRSNELEPQLIDNREGELVREWRQLIIKFLDEWMARIGQAEKKEFSERSADTLDRDENGYFRTRNLVDMWRMLREQVMAAGTSNRTDVVEGVIDAMLVALRNRQSTWQKMVDDECGRYINLAATSSSSSSSSSSPEQQDGYQSLQDWLAAVANDQIACIDDNEVSGQLGYLSRFRRDFEPLVSAGYLDYAATELDRLRDGYVDLGTHCISSFATLIFAVDFRPTLADFFTPRWYGEAGMRRLVSTFEDYLSDYAQVLHHSLLDILVEELSDALLTHYLCCVHNKSAKFRRHHPAAGAGVSADPFEAKLRDDILTAFSFFETHLPPDSFRSLIKPKWRVLDSFARLVAVDKPALPDLVRTFKSDYPDLHLSWLEALLRARDDFDRALWKDVKAALATTTTTASAAGPGAARLETIMSKVK